MRLRIPPGRAGRLWLRARLGAARRAAELLDHKQRELRVELQRLGGIAARRERAWRHAARDAARWLERMDATGAEIPPRLPVAPGAATAAATVEPTWEQVMGVRYPTDCAVRFPPEPCVRSLGGGAALASVLVAHRRAVQAALEHAVARAAVARIRAELDRTARRVRALELRAVPTLERALSARTLVLDEKDREDAVAARWAAGGSAAAPDAGGAR